MNVSYEVTEIYTQSTLLYNLVLALNNVLNINLFIMRGFLDGWHLQSLYACHDCCLQAVQNACIHHT